MMKNEHVVTQETDFVYRNEPNTWAHFGIWRKSGVLRNIEKIGLLIQSSSQSGNYLIETIEKKPNL